MRAPAIWFQWTAVFVILGLGAWVAYPAIDPFESSGGISTFMRLKRAAFRLESPQWKANPAIGKNQERRSP
jgi:hypothetical protein